MFLYRPHCAAVFIVVRLSSADVCAHEQLLLWKHAWCLSHICCYHHYMYQLAGWSLACHSLHSPGVTEQHWQETASFYSPVCDHKEREVVFSLFVCILKKPRTFIPMHLWKELVALNPSCETIKQVRIKKQLVYWMKYNSVVQIAQLWNEVSATKINSCQNNLTVILPKLLVF